MDQKWRDRFIEDILERGGRGFDSGSINFAVNRDYVDAVRECFEKAKAWDELRPFVEAWVKNIAGNHSHCTAMKRAITEKMDELIPPEPEKPKTALEKLKEWASTNYHRRVLGDESNPRLVFLDDLQSEIDRIEREESNG